MSEEIKWVPKGDWSTFTDDIYVRISCSKSMTQIKPSAAMAKKYGFSAGKFMMIGLTATGLALKQCDDTRGYKIGHQKGSSTLVVSTKKLFAECFRTVIKDENIRVDGSVVFLDCPKLIEGKPFFIIPTSHK